MSDVTTTIDTYLAMLNETDPTRRVALVEEAWTSDGRWIDPQLAAEGHGTVAVAGVDVGELADDGRLRRLTGFFGELPDEAAA